MAIKPLQSITLKNDNGEDTTYVVASAPAIVETTEPASVASFSDGAEGIPVKSLIADINPVQTGSGDPSPSNVRPITGWTGMNVVRTGKNLFQTVPFEQKTQNGVTFTYNADGTVTLNGTSTARAYQYLRTYTSGWLENGQTYTASLSGLPSGALSTFINLTYSDNGTTYAGTYGNVTGNNSKTFTTSHNYVAVLLDIPSGQVFNNNTIKVQVQAGSSASDWEPYNGETYPISWADEAGTIYGGTLDVTNGLLTVDRASVVVSSLGLNYNAPQTGHAYFYGTIADKVRPAINDTGHPLMCSMLPYGGAKYASAFTDLAVFQSANANIYIVDDSCANKAAYEAKYNNAQIVYYLATPITYQLTPQAVMTILGHNNIWADTGDVEVAYCADTKMYIDKVIAAL